VREQTKVAAVLRKATPAALYLLRPRIGAGVGCGAAGLLLLQPRDNAGAYKACMLA